MLLLSGMTPSLGHIFFQIILKNLNMIYITMVPSFINFEVLCKYTGIH